MIAALFTDSARAVMTPELESLAGQVMRDLAEAERAERAAHKPATDAAPVKVADPAPVARACLGALAVMRQATTADIAHRTGLDRRAVERAMRRLRDKGAVRRLAWGIYAPGVTG